MLRVPSALSASLFLALCLLAVPTRPASAAWPNRPFTNLPLCMAANDQLSPVIVSDGAGSAIVTWYDYRGGANTDICAQHVLASGTIDPAWPADGRSDAGTRMHPGIYFVRLIVAGQSWTRTVLLLR